MAAVDSAPPCVGVGGDGVGVRAGGPAVARSLIPALKAFEGKGTGAQLRVAHQGPTAHFRLLNESILNAYFPKLTS